MTSAARATGKAAQKPVFQKAENADDTGKDPNDVSNPENFRVEASETTLDASDDVPEYEDAEDPRDAVREEYSQRLEQLEIEHGDNSARVDALEMIVIGLCDTVLGKGVLPVLPTREPDVAP